MSPTRKSVLRLSMNASYVVLFPLRVTYERYHDFCDRTEWWHHKLKALNSRKRICFALSTCTSVLGPNTYISTFLFQTLSIYLLSCLWQTRKFHMHTKQVKLLFYIFFLWGWGEVVGRKEDKEFCSWKKANKFWVYPLQFSPLIPF